METQGNQGQGIGAASESRQARFDRAMAPLLARQEWPAERRRLEPLDPEGIHALGRACAERFGEAPSFSRGLDSELAPLSRALRHEHSAPAFWDPFLAAWAPPIAVAGKIAADFYHSGADEALGAMLGALAPAALHPLIGGLRDDLGLHLAQQCAAEGFDLTCGAIARRAPEWLWERPELDASELHDRHEDGESSFPHHASALWGAARGKEGRCLMAMGPAAALGLLAPLFFSPGASAPTPEQEEMREWARNEIRACLLKLAAEWVLDPQSEKSGSRKRDDATDLAKLLGHGLVCLTPLGAGGEAEPVANAKAPAWENETLSAMERMSAASATRPSSARALWALDHWSLQALCGLSEFAPKLSDFLSVMDGAHPALSRGLGAEIEELIAQKRAPAPASALLSRVQAHQLAGLTPAAPAKASAPKSL